MKVDIDQIILVGELFRWESYEHEVPGPLIRENRTKNYLKLSRGVFLEDEHVIPEEWYKADVKIPNNLSFFHLEGEISVLGFSSVKSRDIPLEAIYSMEEVYSRITKRTPKIHCRLTAWNGG